MEGALASKSVTPGKLRLRQPPVCAERRMTALPKKSAAGGEQTTSATAGGKASPSAAIDEKAVAKGEEHIADALEKGARGLRR